MTDVHPCPQSICLSIYLSIHLHRQLKDAEITKLREEVEAAQDAKRFLTDEVNALKKSHGESHDATSDGYVCMYMDGLEERREKGREGGSVSFVHCRPALFAVMHGWMDGWMYGRAQWP